MQVTEEQLRGLARLADIEIAPGHVPGVIRNLEVLLDQAALLADAGLAAEVEPAAVFRP
ncbi:MAG: AtzG-like protein [Novosphingobium sp.]